MWLRFPFLDGFDFVIAVDPRARVGVVKDGHRLEPAGLERFCRSALDGFDGPLQIAEFHGGASNPTFLLTDAGSGACYVLRKQPPGDLLPTAHAVDREYRVMTALAGTAVPVPRMLAYCDDRTIVGTPFYLMPFLEGRIWKNNGMAGLSPVARRSAYASLIETLAALHAVDPREVGLENFGRQGNYFARQLARWSRQYRDAQTEEIASMERLIEALPARIPSDEKVAIVHGDFRLENLIFAPDEPRVLAVLDWELSTLGDPLADLAFFCLFYHADFTTWGSAATIDFAVTGVPREDELIAAYCTASGRAEIEDWPFYLGFAAFRLASIAQGVHKRQTFHRSNIADRPEHSSRQWSDLAERLLARKK